MNLAPFWAPNSLDENVKSVVCRQYEAKTYIFTWYFMILMNSLHLCIASTFHGRTLSPTRILVSILSFQLHRHQPRFSKQTYPYNLDLFFQPISILRLSTLAKNTSFKNLGGLSRGLWPILNHQADHLFYRDIGLWSHIVRTSILSWRTSYKDHFKKDYFWKEGEQGLDEKF